jgi:hypothetical protein
MVFLRELDGAGKSLFRAFGSDKKDFPDQAMVISKVCLR